MFRLSFFTLFHSGVLGDFAELPVWNKSPLNDTDLSLSGTYTSHNAVIEQTSGLLFTRISGFCYSCVLYCPLWLVNYLHVLLLSISLFLECMVLRRCCELIIWFDKQKCSYTAPLCLVSKQIAYSYEC